MGSKDEAQADSPIIHRRDERLLTKAEFKHLADVPPEAEWFANIQNPNTRKAYRNDVGHFIRFVGIKSPEEFRSVTRAHVIAWRKELEKLLLMPASIRRKLSALSDLFDHLCEANAVSHNPVDGVKRPREGANEGKTPALSDEQAKRLLEAPSPTTPKGRRDRAIIAVLMYHALRRAELCALKVRDYGERRGVKTLTIHGKGGKIRYVEVHPAAIRLMEEHLDGAGKRLESDSPLFQPLKPLHSGQGLSAGSVYRNVVVHYAKRIGIPRIELFGPHALRTTAATNALENGADISRVRQWLGHASTSTTQLYDRRNARAEDSPTFRVKY